MKIITLAAAALTFFLANTASAGQAYIHYDDDGNMVLSGPFNIVIPKPDGARQGPVEHSSPSFLDEKLQVSKAGYFADDQFVMVQVETTNAAAGTLTDKNLPYMNWPAGITGRVQRVWISVRKNWTATMTRCLNTSRHKTYRLCQRYKRFNCLRPLKTERAWALFCTCAFIRMAAMR